MKIATQTDVGLERDSNQDSCRFGYLTKDCSWAIVCDGMGGHLGGNVASDMATNIISGYIIKSFKNNMSYDDVRNLLKKSIENAHNEIRIRSNTDVNLTGMGTTIEFAFCYKDKLLIFHAGDSRSYLIRNNKIVQLSKDHSYVQGLVDSGEMTKEEARLSSQKNIITNALGAFPEIKLDFIDITLESNDVIALATDGLTNNVDDETLKDVILNKKTDSCQTLIDLANKNDGSDNITVALMFVE